MVILGLAGHAAAGKDTVADYLVDRYGFVKFAFSDRLYEEVMYAYGLEDDTLLRDRATKDSPSERLYNAHCNDENFCEVVRQHRSRENEVFSPRQILQWWGTEYRRAQDPDYWLKANDAWLEAVRKFAIYPERVPQHYVNTTCRFPNEQAWIHAKGGNVWHIRRAGLGGINTHVSEQPLPVLEGERELYNNDTIERLYIGVDMMLGLSAKFVRVEPMDKTESPIETA